MGHCERSRQGSMKGLPRAGCPNGGPAGGLLLRQNEIMTMAKPTISTPYTRPKRP